MTEINRTDLEWRALDRAREAALAALVEHDPERAEAIATHALRVGRRLWRGAARGDLRLLEAAADLASLHGKLERMLHRT